MNNFEDLIRLTDELAGGLSAPETSQEDLVRLTDRLAGLSTASPEGTEDLISLTDQLAGFTTAQNPIQQQLDILSGMERELLSLPTPPKPKKVGLLSQVGDFIWDNTKQTLRSALHLLSIPADVAERAQGVVASYLAGESGSLAERWQAAGLYYEEVEASFERLLGIDRGTDRPDRPMSRALDLFKTGSEEAAESYIRLNTGGVADLIGHVILDPLNLIGGLPFVRGTAKLLHVNNIPVLGPTLEFLGTGITRKTPVVGPYVEKLAGLTSRIPILGKIGRSIEEEVYVTGAAKLVDRHLISAIEGVYDQPGFYESLHRVVPTGQVENLMRSIRSALNPVIKSDFFTPESATQFGEALQKGSFQEFLQALPPGLSNRVFITNPTGYGNAKGVGEYLRLLASRALPLRKGGKPRIFDLKSMKSMRPEYVSKVVDKASLHRWQSMFYDELTDIFHRRLVAALEEAGALSGPFGAVARVTSAMKWFMANTILNTPRFVVLNLANNLFTWAFDWSYYFDDNPRRALGLLLPWQRSKTINSILGELGLTRAEVRPLFASADLHLSPWAKEAGLAPKNWLNIGALGTKFATAVDNIFRESALVTGIIRAKPWVRSAVWADLVDELRQTHPDLVAALGEEKLQAISLTAPEVNDVEAFNEWAKLIKAQYLGETAYSDAVRYAQARAAEAGAEAPEAALLYLDDLGEDVIADVQAALQGKLRRAVRIQEHVPEGAPRAPEASGARGLEEVPEGAPLEAPRAEVSIEAPEAPRAPAPEAPRAPEAPALGAAPEAPRFEDYPRLEGPPKPGDELVVRGREGRAIPVRVLKVSGDRISGYSIRVSAPSGREYILPLGRFRRPLPAALTPAAPTPAVPAAAAAPAPAVPAVVLEELSKLETPHAAMAEHALNRLEARGFDTSKARAALERYRNLGREAKGSAAERRAARLAAWEDFRGEVRALRTPEAPEALAREVPAPPPEAAPEAPLSASAEELLEILRTQGLSSIPSVEFAPIEDAISALEELRGQYGAAAIAAGMLDEVPYGAHPYYFDSATGQALFDEHLHRELLARQLGQQHAVLTALGIPEETSLGLMQVAVSEYASRLDNWAEAWATVDRGWEMLRSGKNRYHAINTIRKGYRQMTEVREAELEIFRARRAGTLEYLATYDKGVERFMQKYFDLVEDTMVKDRRLMEEYVRSISKDPAAKNFAAKVSASYLEMARERAKLWNQYQRDVHVLFGGVGTTPKPRMVNEAPNLSGNVRARFLAATDYIDRVISRLRSPGAARDLNLAEAVPLDITPLVAGWLDRVDLYRSKLLQAGVAMKDFVMLDYDNLRGFERLLQVVFPYEFWPTRTIWHWGRRLMARPGGVSALLDLNESLRDLNSDLPARFRNKIRLPIPFSQDLIPGAAPDLFIFDPLSLMFPLANWVNDFQEQEDGQKTLFQTLIERAEGGGLTFNPIFQAAARGTGLLPGKEETFSIVRGGLPLVGPLGSTQMLRGLLRFLAEGTPLNDPDGEFAEMARTILTKGYLPEDVLQKLVGIPHGDRFDQYRIDRALASIVAERARDLPPDEKELLVHEALRQLFERKGPLYEEARRFANRESGLRELTGWLLGGGGFTIWHDGEQTQRGLSALFNAAMENDRLDLFYQIYPEYRVRQVALAGLGDTGPTLAEREVELQTTLFWMDLAKLIKEEDAFLRDLLATRDALQKEIDALSASDLTLRIVRERRAALIDQAKEVSEQINAIRDEYAKRRKDLELAYPKAETAPSIRRAPADRAMSMLLSEYYSKLRELPPEQRDAFREEFLSQFPARPAGFDFYSQWAITVRAIQTLRDYDERMKGASTAARKALEEERDAVIELLTEEARSLFSRRDVEERLALSTRPTPPGLAEYYEAVRLFQEYEAIPRHLTQARKEFWDSHPLLEKYYGLESYAGHPDEAIQRAKARYFDILEQADKLPPAERDRFLEAHRGELKELRNFIGPSGDPDRDRWSELWSQYFDLPPGDARRAFLRQHQAEINHLELVLGKEPSPKARAAAREAAIWQHYYSLSNSRDRRNYLLLVQDELNELRRLLGKDPIEVMGDNSSSPPAPITDLLPALDLSLEVVMPLAAP